MASETRENKPGASQAEESALFKVAIKRFDEENGRDPNREIVNGQPRPRELVYSEWLTAWVLRLRPDASEALRLAARCQHLCRWMIPRGTYPQTREGYLKWRADLKQFHAHRAGEVLHDIGYSEEVIARVQSLNLKKNPGADAECRVLEDALCLVFLEHQLRDLAAKSSEEKMISALRKAWKKMSAQGRENAMQLSLGERERTLLARALSGAD